MRGRQVQHRQRACAKRFNLRERLLLRAIPDPPTGTYPNRTGFLHYRQQSSRKTAGHGFVDFAPRYAI